MTQTWTVLFDLGGVLSDDPWESICLTPRWGLASALGLDPATVKEVGLQLWSTHSLRPSMECEYWHEFGQHLGITVPIDQVRRAEVTSWHFNRQSAALFAAAHKLSGGHVGILTDNTHFWFSKQAQHLRWQAWVSPDLELPSFRFGLSKHDGGLFKLATERVQTDQVLFIDDRKDNIMAAESYGFQTFEYGGPHADTELLVHLERLLSDREA